MLAERVELLQKGEQSRVAIVASVKSKRKSSASKKSRRKYRALEEAKTQAEATGPSEAVEGGGGAGKDSQGGS